MQHYLIYSQSDQRTLRSPALDGAFHGVAVPGTIVGYFPDATAAFILASKKPYFIDIKTPLFQGPLVDARPSHAALAQRLSPTLAQRIADLGTLDPNFYRNQVVLDELVNGSIAFQRNYAGQGTTLGVKLERYARLRAEARGEELVQSALEGLMPPEMVLAPYFCSTTSENDPWLGVTHAIWQTISQSPHAADVSAVVALDSSDPADLARMLPLVPPTMSRRVLFWLTNFDERSQPAARLAALWRIVETYSSDHELINLYGSYFSIILSKVGLYGFNNGIAYSEFRRWPELGASGAAPARYYVPRLHAFLSPGDAQLLLDVEPWFACPCPVCEQARFGDRPSVIGLSFHELKAHFVFARKLELDFVAAHDFAGIEDQLRETAERAANVRSGDVPAPSRLSSGHLDIWVDAMRLARGG